MKQRFRCRIPMKLQLFAGEGDGGGTGGTGGTQEPQNIQQQSGQGVQIDYGRIQQMLDGTMATREDAALKAYFKQQGLSQQEMEQAIAAFKQQKADNTPDVGAMQAQLSQAQALAQQAQIESAATMAAVSLGIDAKTIPYITKMADLSKAVGQDGKINNEEITNALNKVLEDIPALKPQTQQASGLKFGASGQGQQTTATEDALKQAFGL